MYIYMYSERRRKICSGMYGNSSEFVGPTFRLNKYVSPARVKIDFCGNWVEVSPDFVLLDQGDSQIVDCMKVR